MLCPLRLDGEVFLLVLCMFVGTRQAVSLRGEGCCGCFFGHGVPCPYEVLLAGVFLLLLMFVGIRHAVSLRGADGSLMLIVMVGQMIDDCICPIKLLNEQQTYHLMRKGHL